jgi:hypothetical protein
MLAIQLKNYLESVPDNANILIYVNKTDEVRSLLNSDLDRDSKGSIIIDAEYKAPTKKKHNNDAPIVIFEKSNK